ncbi:MAG: EpsI family protein [Halioglobus sp.]|nr:EpsI family protein [Halioglobus sp.]
MLTSVIKDPDFDWRPHALILIAMLVIIAAYWASYSVMLGMWSLATYEYGWFVFPISGAMLWHNRIRIENAPLSSSFPALLILCGLVFAWLFAKAVSVQVVELAAAILLIPVLVWASGGSRLFRAAMFPLLFLVLAVPTGEALVPWLMLVTADISAWLLDTVGVPAFREGMFLTLPGGQFEVADVCSGLRYLLTGTVLGILFAYLNYNSIVKRAAFVVIVAISFIVANGVRAFLVMLVASVTDMRHFTGYDHVVFGMILFALLAVALMYVGSKYADDAQETVQSRKDKDPDSWTFPVPMLAVLVLLTGPLSQQIRGGETLEPAYLPVSASELPGCVRLDAWLPDWTPVMKGADRESRQSWQCGKIELSLFQSVYRQQQQGKELASAVNTIWPHDWRRAARVATVELSTATRNLTVQEVIVEGGERSRLVWYWYDIDGYTASTPLGAKLREGLGAVFLETPNSALLVFVAEGSASYDTLRAGIESSLAGIY